MFRDKSQWDQFNNIFIHFLQALGSVRSSPGEEVCYSDRTDPYILFATKTSYFAVGNSLDTDKIEYEGKEVVTGTSGR